MPPNPLNASPAARLKLAADKLRTLATAATPGPWEGVVDHHQRGEVNASVWADSIDYYVTEQVTSGERHEDDARYIGLVHPGVGLSIADWLERQGRVAAEVEQYLGEEFQDGALDQNIHDALAIASQILQEPRP